MPLRFDRLGAIIFPQVAFELAEEVEGDGYETAGIGSFAGYMLDLVELFYEGVGLEDAQRAFDLMRQVGETVVILIGESAFQILEICGKGVEEGSYIIADKVFVADLFQ